MPRLAQRYRITLEPSVSPTFPENDDVYFGDGPKVTPPVFLPWPQAKELMSLGGSGAAFPPYLPGPEPDRWIDALSDNSTYNIETPLGTRRAIARTLTHGLMITAKPFVRTSHAVGYWLHHRAAPRRLQRTTADSQLEEQLRSQERPDAFETRSGFAVGGEAVVGIWTTDDVTAEVRSRPDWWSIRPENQVVLGLPAPVLIELASGVFAASTALPDFIASVVATDRGVSALVYREVGAAPQVAKATEEAIGKLERGAMRADEATDLAVELRHGKHADPVRGVISAYLYDSIGDVESIRRMAFYYIQHGQAIPYDIALLAQLEGERRNDGLLWVTVPAVPSRKPRTEQERRVGWTHSATPKATGAVAGFWPWLRQGWPFLDEPAADGSTLVLPGLIELAAELTSARFTTLRNAGGRRLASVFDLSDSASEGSNS